MKVDLEVLLGVMAQAVVIIAAGAAGTVWLRRWLRAQVAEPVAKITTEVHTNDGKSMADKIGKIEANVGHVETVAMGIAHRVEILHQRLDDHLRFGHSRGEVP